MQGIETPVSVGWFPQYGNVWSMSLLPRVGKYNKCHGSYGFDAIQKNTTFKTTCNFASDEFMQPCFINKRTRDVFFRCSFLGTSIRLRRMSIFCLKGGFNNFNVTLVGYCFKDDSYSPCQLIWHLKINGGRLLSSREGLFSGAIQGGYFPTLFQCCLISGTFIAKPVRKS